MKSKSIEGTSLEEIRIGLGQILIDGYNPTLAFVFLTELEDINTNGF